jgi:hypothetical protein
MQRFRISSAQMVGLLKEVDMGAMVGMAPRNAFRPEVLELLAAAPWATAAIEARATKDSNRCKPACDHRRTNRDQWAAAGCALASLHTRRCSQGCG